MARFGLLRFHGAEEDVMRAHKLLGALVLATLSQGRAHAADAPARPSAETQAVVAFQARLADYLALHR